jgi:CDP-diacylglycerol--glycerol-3-phosphate 3-phosphatidyltransferase
MIAAITDWLDGFIARRYNLVTKIGAVLDPIADKMLVAAALVLLAQSGAIFGWMAGLLLCREIGISGLRLVALEKGVTISVSQWGKWKTIALDVGIVCMMVNRPLFGWPWVEVGMISMWIALALSVFSAWQYTQAFLQKTHL